MSEVFGYVYKITNKLNGRMYVGQHRGDKIDYHYLGSSPELCEDVKKYGFPNFDVEVLQWCTSREELNIVEHDIIEQLDCINSEKYYNTHAGGGVSDRSEETIVKMQEAFKRRDQSYFDQLSGNMKGRIGVHKDGVVKFVWPKDLEEYKRHGFVEGTPPYSQERVNKVKQALTGYPRSDEFREKARKCRDGKIFINKDNICKIVTPEEFETFYMIEGWKKGRLKRK